MKKKHSLSTSRLALAILAMTPFALTPTHLSALPTGFAPAIGASSTLTVGTTMTVTAADLAVIEWSGFSISSGSTVNFVQPSSSAAVLNKVVNSLSASTIAGTLGANGRVFLVNQNGITIASGAAINTAGFAASTIDEGYANFVSTGTLALSGLTTQPVTVSGGAITSVGGNIWLAGTGVSITGGTLTTTTSGDVILSSRGTSTINMTGGTISAAGNVNGTTQNGAIALGTMTAGGGLNLTAVGGTIAQSGGAWFINGATNFTATGNNITVTNAGNNFGTISASGANISITEAATIDAGTITATGNLVLANTAGNITNSGVLTVTGTSTFTAPNGSVTVNTAGNTFGGAVSMVAGTTGTLVAAGPINLGASFTGGSASVTAGGAITQSGALNFNGSATFNAGANNLTLGDAANNFGTIFVTGNNVAITEGATSRYGASTVTGTFAATTGGDLLQSAALNVTGNATLTATGLINLPNVANNFGTVALSSGGNSTLTENLAVNLAASTVGGALTVTSVNSNITQAGALTVTAGGLIASATNGSITLNNPSNVVGGAAPVVLTSGLATNYVENSPIVFGNVFTGGAFTTNSTDNAITQAASTAIIANGAANIDSGTAATTLANTGNSFGALTLRGIGVTLVESGTVNLADVTAPAGSGFFTITSLNGDIVRSGTGDLDFHPHPATLTAANGSITLATNVDFADSAAAGSPTTSIVAGGNVTIGEQDNFRFGNSWIGGSLTLSTSGPLAPGLTQSAPVIVNGAVSVTTDNHITWNHSGNSFGALNLTGNNIAITEGATVNLAALNATGTFSATSVNGNVISSGNNLVVLGNSAFTAANGAVTITGSGNSFGAVTLVSGLSATFAEAFTTDFASVFTTPGASLTATTTSGGFTQSGPMIVNGALNLTATGAGNNITVTGAGNSFGMVNLTTTGNAAITEAATMNLGTLTIGGTFTGTTSGVTSDIVDSGTLSVIGAASFRSSRNIVIDGLNHSFGTLTFSGVNVQIIENPAMVFDGLAGTDVTGNLVLQSLTGSITRAALGTATDVTGNATFLAQGNITVTVLNSLVVGGNTLAFSGGGNVNFAGSGATNFTGAFTGTAPLGTVAPPSP